MIFFCALDFKTDANIKKSMIEEAKSISVVVIMHKN